MDKYKFFSVSFGLLAGLVIFLGLVGCQDIFLLKQWGTIKNMESNGTNTTTPKLTWDAVDGADEYEVWILPVYGEPEISTDSFLQVSSALTNNTTYFWKVRALDTQPDSTTDETPISRAGAWSETLTFTVNAISVTGLSGYTKITAVVNTAIEDQSPTVTPNGATGTYAIEPTLPTGLSLDTATGTLSGTPTEVSALATYTITFTANGNYEGNLSQSITIEVLMADAPPGAPTIGSPIDSSMQVTVLWTAPTDTGYNGGVAATITGYTVYYSPVQGFTKENAEDSKNADATATEIVVDGLTNATTYYFLVTATNATGEGESSEIKSSVLAGYYVGDTGPANGIVFYVEKIYSGGWRYLEAARTDQSESTGSKWGELGGNSIEVGRTSESIGSGKANTDRIVSELTKLKISIGTYAAGVCSEYSTTVDGNTFDDWFLPSSDELNELYKQRDVVGNFASESEDYYWSSTESGPDEGMMQFFDDGDQSFSFKNRGGHVRSVRAF